MITRGIMAAARALLGLDPESVPMHSDLGSAAYASLQQAQDQKTTGWTDLVHPLLAGGIPGASAPTLTDFGNPVFRKEYAFAINNTMHVPAFNINHDVKPNGKAYVSVRWTSDGTNLQPVRWEFTLSRALGHNQANITTAAAVVTTQTPHGTSWRYMFAEVSAADAVTLIEPDGVIFVTLKRLTNGGTDNTDAIFPIIVGLHYESDRHNTVNKAPNFYGA